MYKNISNNYDKNYSGGFTLLGTLFSAFLAVIVIAAIASLSAQVYGSSRNSRDRFIATGLAKEGIELVRNMRDGNWLFYEYDTTTIPGSSLPTKKIKWRGDGSGSSCATNESCLRDLCNGSFTVDAFDPNLALRPSSVRSLDTKLKLVSSNGDNNEYNYTSGEDTIFSRTITIDTPGGGNCGDEVNGDLTTAPTPIAPNPMVVTSTVSWGNSTVVLKESLYDWMLQRP